MIYSSISDLTGNTPVVKLNRITEGLGAEIYVKIEAFNPLSSVKDRIAKEMIEEAERTGKINQNTLLIEATSGNTGIGLAFNAAAKGYKIALVMPETMSLERRKLLKALGAELILTPGEKGMKGAIDKAEELGKENENSFILRQFENSANPQAHIKTTAPEILKDFPDGVDAFVSGIGTGGTVTGTSTVLKKEWPNLFVAGVEPFESAVLSGEKPGPHKIQGIGAGFVPDVLKTDLLDEVIKINGADAGVAARRLAKEEGILVGISSGAALAGALELAKRPEFKGKKILAILPDSGERYLSTWLFED